LIASEDSPHSCKLIDICSKVRQQAGQNFLESEQTNSKEETAKNNNSSSAERCAFPI